MKRQCTLSNFSQYAEEKKKRSCGSNICCKKTICPLLCDRVWTVRLCRLLLYSLSGSSWCTTCVSFSPSLFHTDLVLLRGKHVDSQVLKNGIPEWQGWMKACTSIMLNKFLHDSVIIGLTYGHSRIGPPGYVDQIFMLMYSIKSS